MISDKDINNRIELRENEPNSSQMDSTNKKLDIDTQMILCSECDEENNEKANFCQNCGFELTYLKNYLQNNKEFIEKQNGILLKIPLLNLSLVLNTKSLLDLIIAILIIFDTFFLLLMDFSNVNAITAQNITNFDLTVCFVLFCEFIFRLRKAEDKKAFFKDKNNWIAIIAMIPINFFVFRIFRYIKILPLLYKGLKHFNKFLRETRLDWSFGILVLTIFTGTILFFIFEHGVNGNVHSLWDSFMYVMPTIATEGSNNIYPQTFVGKIIGIVLMVIGIISFGLFTASIAAIFINSHEDKLEHTKVLNELKDTTKNLEKEIKEIKTLLKRNK